MHNNYFEDSKKYRKHSEIALLCQNFTLEAKFLSFLKNKFTCFWDFSRPFLRRPKKNPVFQKTHKVRDFLFSMNDIWANIGQKCIIFSSHIVLSSQPHRKKFSWSYHENSKNKLQIPEKKPSFPKTWTTLKFLPIGKKLEIAWLPKMKI